MRENVIFIVRMEYLKMKEAEARYKHGWVTVKGADTVVTDAKEK